MEQRQTKSSVQGSSSRCARKRMTSESREPLVEVLLAPKEHGARRRSASPAQREAATAAPGDAAVKASLVVLPPSEQPRAAHRSLRSRASAAARAGARSVLAAVRAALLLLLRAVVFALFAALRLCQLSAFALAWTGLPYALSGPVTLLALLASLLLLLLKAPSWLLRRGSSSASGHAKMRVFAAAADAALLALAGAMLADHCGCRGGAPLPAAAYKAARRTLVAAARAAEAPQPASLAYAAYAAACDLVC